MSLSLDSLDLIHVIDPRVDVNARERREYGVISSGNENNFRVFPSTSFSSSNIDWTCNPPNRETYVNRRAYKRVQFQLDFTGTAGAGQHLIEASGLPSAAGVSPGNMQYDAPRNLPLSRAFTTEKVVINGLSFMAESGRFWHGLERYHNSPSNQDGDASMSPSMPDQFQSYTLHQLSARNPFRAYHDNPLQCPRGGFIGAVITQNSSSADPLPHTARVILTVTEPIYVSPFLFGENEEEQAFIGIDTMTVNAQLGGRGNGTFAGLVGSLWSHASNSPSVFTNASATVLSADLLFNYITPDLTQVIPPTVNYSLYNPTLYQTQFVAGSAVGSTIEYPMNTVTLTSIPSRMYVWVADSDNAFNWQSSDAFFAISRILVQFENRPVQISEATPQDLYEMAKRNGCNESFRQWSNDVGSVACITFGNDLALQPTQSPGLTGKYTMSLRVTATNVGLSTVSPTLSVLVIQDGVFTISSGKCYSTIGPLTPQNVLDAKKEAPIKYKPSANVYGGAFWDNVLSWAKRLGRAAINIGKAVPNPYQGAFQAADPLARELGFGANGRGVSGGKRVSRAQMMKLLK